MDVFSVIIMILCFTTAFLLIWLPVSMHLRIHECKTPVMAEYIKYNTYYSGRGQHSYAPVFRYTYQGELYERQSPISYPSYKRLDKTYQVGNTYQIWISDKKPKHMIDKKKLPLSQHIIYIFGLMMLAMCILAFCDKLNH